MPMRKVQFGTKRGNVVHEKPVNENQSPKDDGQRSSSDAWNDPKKIAMKPIEATPSSPQKKSFFNDVTKEINNPTNLKVNFRSLVNIDQVENSNCVLFVEHVIAAQDKFANSLVGFFVGNKVAFQLVQNYVSNTWSKFGFQKVMHDDDVYYFKFTSMTGLEQVLEKGPWLIRNQPLILTKWSPNMTLSKDKVTQVPVYVKGRLGFARALIEVAVKKELKHEVTMVVPVVDEEGHAMVKTKVEYEWKPPRCSECLVFGHTNEQCPKRVKVLKEDATTQSDGFTTVQNRKKKGKKAGNDKTKEDSSKLVNPNPFDVLNAMERENDMGESCGRKKEPITLKDNENDTDYEREVEEMVRQVVSENQLSVCAILDSHVDISALATVCSKVFQNWEWTSNANLCNKGCRIILGWNKDVVDIVVMAQTDLAVHAKVIHHADQKAICCTFIYAGNDPRERRVLWADRSSSSMNSAMCDFKDCVRSIEVMDIHSTRLHFIWNQKPRGRNGVLKKLDLIMGNLEFIYTYQGAYVVFQPYRILAHSLSVLKIPSLMFTKPRPFRFYNFLVHKGSFLEVLNTHSNISVAGHSMLQVT
nr:hypothetical protein [Tanacetum cinerariifolium]